LLVKLRWIAPVGRRTKILLYRCAIPAADASGGEGEGEGATGIGTGSKNPSGLVKWGIRVAAGAGVLFAALLGYDLMRFARSLEHNTFDSWRKLLKGDKQENPLAGSAGEPTVIYDIRGRVVATLSTGTIPLYEVSDYMWQAVVSSEDHRFFHHHGIDPVGVLRAVKTLGKGGGGSSITQQLVKNMLLNQSRSISRKLVEMVMSVILERLMSKPQIIETYLNNVYWGHGTTGIASASATYFRKRPLHLTLNEAALLAALLPAPEYLSPYRNPAKAVRVTIPR
jgi:membrane peptidoglycan carboxypeptidase